MTRSPRGAATVDFVLATVVLLPLVLGILHVALVLHVRNTLVSAAAEGARVAATADGSLDLGVARTRRQIGTALATRFADGVTARRTMRDGLAVVEVEVVADVPPLGLWGPATHLDVSAHALREPGS